MLHNTLRGAELGGAEGEGEGGGGRDGKGWRSGRVGGRWRSGVMIHEGVSKPRLT